MERWQKEAKYPALKEGHEELNQQNSPSSDLSVSSSPSRNWSHSTNSDASVSSWSVRLPLINAKPVTVKMDDISGAAISFPHQLSAPEMEIRSYGQLTTRPNHDMAERLQTEQELSLEKGVEKGQICTGKGLELTEQALCNSTVSNADVDETVLRRTEMYRHRGRRYSLPLSNPLRNKPHQISQAVWFEKPATVYDQQTSKASMDKSKSKLSLAESDESEHLASRLEHYKRLGRRNSLPHQPNLFDEGRKLLSEGVGERESQNRGSSLGSSLLGKSKLPAHCTENMTNLTSLNEDPEEPARRIQRYIHRGRRFSLPPVNIDTNKNPKNTNTDNATKTKPNRPPTPAASRINWKCVGWHNNRILSKSTECLAHTCTQPVPEAGTLQTAGKDKSSQPRADNQVQFDKYISDSPEVKRSAFGSTGVTWETVPTHKTFSFVYNDENNKSEMVSPPLVGGVVLKSVHVDHQPAESVSIQSEQLTSEVYVNIDNNNTVSPHAKTSCSTGKAIPPTEQILKGSWRREDEQEKTIRILKWILDEQAQRTIGIEAQNLN